MDTLDGVKKVVGEVLEVDPAELDADASLTSDLGMDSILAIDITSGLERLYKVRIPEDRLADFESVRAIAGIVDELLAARK